MKKTIILAALLASCATPALAGWSDGHVPGEQIRVVSGDIVDIKGKHHTVAGYYAAKIDSSCDMERESAALAKKKLFDILQAAPEVEVIFPVTGGSYKDALDDEPVVLKIGGTDVSSMMIQAGLGDNGSRNWCDNPAEALVNFDETGSDQQQAQPASDFDSAVMAAAAFANKFISEGQYFFDQRMWGAYVLGAGDDACGHPVPDDMDHKAILMTISGMKTDPDSATENRASYDFFATNSAERCVAFVKAVFPDMKATLKTYRVTRNTVACDSHESFVFPGGKRTKEQLRQMIDPVMGACRFVKKGSKVTVYPWIQPADKDDAMTRDTVKAATDESGVSGSFTYYALEDLK